jgi:hypothetical protein
LTIGQGHQGLIKLAAKPDDILIGDQENTDGFDGLDLEVSTENGNLGDSHAAMIPPARFLARRSPPCARSWSA